VNGAAISLIKEGGFRAVFDMPCLPHTINTVGENLNVRLALDFLHSLVNLFNSAGMAPGFLITYVNDVLFCDSNQCAALHV
jgi:hypothetical protein